MIILESSGVKGLLAQALKEMDPKDKENLMYYFSRSSIDFNRTITKSEKVFAKDPRLSVQGNIVIGVYEDENGSLNISAFEVGRNAISNNQSTLGVVNPSTGNTDQVVLAKLSWNKWLKYMKEVYIITENDVVSNRKLRLDRYHSQRVDTTPQVWKTAELLVKKYGFKVSMNRIFGTVDFSRVVRHDDIHYSVECSYKISKPENSEISARVYVDGITPDLSEYLKCLENASNLMIKLSKMNLPVDDDI